jgi:hypothetical protein
MWRRTYMWRLWRYILVCVTGFLPAFVNAGSKIHVSDSCLLLHCVAAFMKPFISYMADVIVFKAVANLLFLWYSCGSGTRTHTHTHRGNFMGVNLPFFILRKAKSYRTAVCGFVLCIAMNVYSKNYVSEEQLYIGPYYCVSRNVEFQCNKIVSALLLCLSKACDWLIDWLIPVCWLFLFATELVCRLMYSGI